MSTTTVIPPARAVELAEQRCGVYRDELGWNTFRDGRTGAVVLRADRQWAVIVPKAFGLQLRSRLRERPAPMFSIDRAMWVFITGRPGTVIDRAEVSVSLTRLGAVPVLPGATVALPTPGDHRRCWLDAPGRVRVLPSFGVVVDALLAAGEADRWP
ncbi:hypothetical protein [Nocardia wallacei]|uniref:hypothetical protein n=1 Tax=Nocardia wallacei TaxID=480035 RepID=UPI0024551E61|nr:hypothetical protein [Nocardia wallacei]